MRHSKIVHKELYKQVKEIIYSLQIQCKKQLFLAKLSYHLLFPRC